MIFTKPPGWSKPPIRYSMFVRSSSLFVSSSAKDNYTTLYFGCQYCQSLKFLRFRTLDFL